jgi:glycosyltransferase involved in cell wall biosynthesis
VFEISIDCREIVIGRRTGLSRNLIAFLKAVAKNQKSSLLLVDEQTDTNFLSQIFRGVSYDFAFIRKSGVFYDQFIIPKLVFCRAKKFFSIYPKFPVILPFLGVEVYVFIADIISFSWLQISFLTLFGRLPKKIFTPTDTSKYKIEKVVKREVIRVYQDLSYILKDELNSSVDEEISLAMEKKGIEKGKFILYVGNFNPHKNVEVLIRAFNLIENLVLGLGLKLVLAGGGGKKGKEILEADKIKIIGNVDDQVLRWLYRNSLFFICPSLDEGHGLPPLEACCFGKAVIVSDIPVFRETMGRCAIFFDPKSPKDLAEKILLLYKNETLRKELEAKSKEVAKFFTSFDFGEKILEHIFSE